MTQGALGLEHKPVRNIDMKSGWEVTVAKKASAKERKRGNARLFCHMYKKGRWKDWTPYKRPRSRHEMRLGDG